MNQTKTPTTRKARKENGGSRSSTAPCSASFWCVRFQTQDEMYHPVWWGKRGGPEIARHTIKKLAEKYLADNDHWLVGIAEIYAPE